jgi:hypothetical protein
VAALLCNSGLRTPQTVVDFSVTVDVDHCLMIAVEFAHKRFMTNLFAAGRRCVQRSLRGKII